MGRPAVVFDYGGVIITPITSKLSEIADTHGVEMMVMLELLMGPRYTSGDHPWHRAERGELPTDALQSLIEPYAADAGIALVGDEYARLLDSPTYRYNTQVVDRIAQLRADGVTTALLTNSFQEFRPVLESQLDFALFDVVVDSSAEGCRKPEPEIYAIVAERVATTPDHTIYLDDFHHNLGPAIELGWKVIHVSDPDEALEQLDRQLAALTGDATTNDGGER